MRLVFASAVAGRPVSDALFTEVLPGTDTLLEFLVVVVSCAGDRTTVLIDLVERDLFAAAGAFGLEQAALALYCAWRLGGGVSGDRITAQLRRLARKPLNVPAGILVGALAREIGDEHLLTVASRWLAHA